MFTEIMELGEERKTVWLVEQYKFNSNKWGKINFQRVKFEVFVQCPTAD